MISKSQEETEVSWHLEEWGPEAGCPTLAFFARVGPRTYTDRNGGLRNAAWSDVRNSSTGLRRIVAAAAQPERLPTFQLQPAS